jgi:nicotinamide riboside kinase
MVYARHYYGACPLWIEQAARERRSDLYLLCHPDVPWVADALQHDRGFLREEMHALFVAALAEVGARVVHVRGDWTARREVARRAVEALLAAQPAAS